MGFLWQGYILACYDLAVSCNQVFRDDTPGYTIHRHVMTDEYKHITCRKMIYADFHDGAMLEVNRSMKLACVGSNLVFAINDHFREIIQFLVWLVDE